MSEPFYLVPGERVVLTAPPVALLVHQLPVPGQLEAAPGATLTDLVGPFLAVAAGDVAQALEQSCLGDVRDVTAALTEPGERAAVVITAVTAPGWPRVRS